MMKQWICKKCSGVIGGLSPKCCGKMEEFNPEFHWQRLLPNSNGWARIHRKWHNHPFFRQVSNELAKDQCFSAPIHFSEAIGKLIEFYEENGHEYNEDD